MSLHGLKSAYKPDADIIVYNGFPVSDDVAVQAGDQICFIRRGEHPSLEEMKHLIVSRHSPEVYEKVINKTIGIAGVGDHLGGHQVRPCDLSIALLAALQSRPHTRPLRRDVVGGSVQAWQGIGGIRGSP